MNCSYCKNVDTGDDYLPLLSGVLNFGFFGNADVDVFLAREKGIATMYLGICQNEGTGQFKTSFPIEYCPICGRKLNVDSD